MEDKFIIVSRFGPRTKIRKHINQKGYVMIKYPEHPHANKQGYIQEHRLVYEQWLGTPLDRDEVIHHMDGNKQNNSRDNLMLMLKKDHDRLNYELRPLKRWPTHGKWSC